MVRVTLHSRNVVVGSYAMNTATVAATSSNSRQTSPTNDLHRAHAM